LLLVVAFLNAMGEEKRLDNGTFFTHLLLVVVAFLSAVEEEEDWLLFVRRCFALFKRGGGERGW